MRTCGAQTIARARSQGEVEPQRLVELFGEPGIEGADDGSDAFDGDRADLLRVRLRIASEPSRRFLRA